MDDQTRDELLAKLADGRARATQVRDQLKTYAATITDVRKALGNPYFYGGRSADDPESEAHYTGYKSFEPAFQLSHDLRAIRREVLGIRNRLRDAGVSTD